MNRAIEYLESTHMASHQAERCALHVARLACTALDYCSCFSRDRGLVASVTVQAAFALHRYFSSWLIEKVANIFLHV